MKELCRRPSGLLAALIAALLALWFW